MIKLMIVEDNAIVRRGLITVIERETDITIVGEAENGANAISMLNGGVDCTMLLADLNMPLMDGIELTEVLVKKFPQIKVVILTMHAKRDYLEKARQAGASGFLLKHLDAEDLVDALRRINDGEVLLM